MMPMLAVVSSSSLPSRIAATARAAATTALRPRSGAMPACAAAPRNSASMRFCVGEATIERARRAIAVEHEHAPRREQAEVERLGAEQPRLLAGSEHELDVARRAARATSPRASTRRTATRRLVVGAEHRGAVGAHEAVGDDDLRRALDGDRVEVGAESDRRRLATPRDARDEIAAAAPGDRSAVVLVHAEAELAEVSLDDVGDLPLGAGRRGDAGETDEEIEELVV